MARINFLFARQKAKFATEESAFNDIKGKQDISSLNLVADHKEKMWYWVPSLETVENPNLFTVAKTPDFKFQKAIQLAMDHFETFEANITIHNQDEDNIVFKKLKG
jgi:hypothetical protein